MKRLLLMCVLSALVFASAAAATATSTYPVSASSTRAAIVTWTTNRVGDLTMTLQYSAKGPIAFNVPVNAPCTTTTGPGIITYSCVSAPAGSYSATIWPDRGKLSGTLTVTGETD